MKCRVGTLLALLSASISSCASNNYSSIKLSQINFPRIIPSSDEHGFVRRDPPIFHEGRLVLANDNCIYYGGRDGYLILWPEDAALVKDGKNLIVSFPEDNYLYKSMTVGETVMLGGSKLNSSDINTKTKLPFQLIDQLKRV